ncbi:MAG: hotdog domain-containing protein [Pseudomonadota bacterium]
MKGLRTFSTYRLVKSEDLNHHGTLFAGRSAEWLIESGFIAATEKIRPEHLICLKLHGMHFLKPAKSGDVVCYESRVVFAGTTSIVTYTRVFNRQDMEKMVVDGFTTFIHVNKHTIPAPHKIVVKPVTAEEKKLYNEAKSLRK